MVHPLPIMNRRVLAIGALAAYCLLPLFCLGGVISHPCPRDGDECGHEELCSQDPCSQFALASRTDDPDTDQPGPLAPAVPAPYLSLRPAPTLPFPALPSRERIPLAASLVLLI
jgi:hypothetical protein